VFREGINTGLTPVNTLLVGDIVRLGNGEESQSMKLMRQDNRWSGNFMLGTGTGHWVGVGRRRVEVRRWKGGFPNIHQESL